MAKTLASVSKYAWLPIPVLLIVIIYAEITGIHYARENTVLLLILNLIFTTFTSFLIIYLTGRSFLISGRVALVLFTCAAMSWGLAGPVSGIFGDKNPNTTITIYNVCVLISSSLYLCGAFTWSRQKMSISFPGMWLSLSVFIILTLILLIVILASEGLIPLFYIEHKGGTALRYIVLMASIFMFALTAAVLWISSRTLKLHSLYWYSIALGLLAIGMLGVMLLQRMGDFLNWTGRFAQFLSGVYMVVAAVRLVKETNVWENSIEIELNRKRQIAEDALKKSEERYRQIVELAGDGIIILDDKFYITEWNRAAELLFGWTAEEVIGQPHEFLKSDLPAYEFNKFLKDPTEILHYETRKLRKDGSPVDVEVKLSALIDDEGKIRGYIVVNHDVTERKQSEQQLQLSQYRLNIALENANIGLWEWDFINNQLYWDEKTERMFGLVPGTFKKTNEAFEELIHEEDIQRIRSASILSAEKGVPFEAVFRLRSAQNPRFISSKAFVTKNKDGKPEHMLGVCFDITAFKEDTDKAIIRLNQDLSRSNRDLRDFAYVASHDLQEPLRMVTSFTQLLKMRYADKLDEDANTYIDYAVDGSRRMYELINGLLEYSRVGTRGKEFTMVDMNEVVATVKTNLMLRLKETQAVLYCDKLPVIYADGNQMIQIIQNLVENSIKFSKENPEISISSKHEDGFNIFSVSDNGIGIEPQYYDRIFRIFQRLHTKDKYGGMGIGLSICQRIVERHGGKIWVESNSGHGSVFYFSIPQKEIVV